LKLQINTDSWSKMNAFYALVPDHKVRGLYGQRLFERLELVCKAIGNSTSLTRTECLVRVIPTLKTPYRDGTTQVVFDRGGHPPIDFVARLAALARARSDPNPASTSLVTTASWSYAARPNHRCRGLVTPGRRGKGIKSIANAEVRTPAERHAAMTWAQRLKRVFNIDIEVCSRCGGSVRVIASIEDQETVDRILDHLRQKEQETPARPLLVPPTRAPPGTLSLFAGKDSRPTATH
jgi:hypothetical protein